MYYNMHLILNIWYLISDTWYILFDIRDFISYAWHVILDVWYMLFDICLAKKILPLAPVVHLVILFSCVRNSTTWKFIDIGRQRTKSRHNSKWPWIVLYGPILSSMVWYGPLTSPMVPYGPAWSFMVLYDLKLSLMVPNGMVQ